MVSSFDDGKITATYGSWIGANDVARCCRVFSIGGENRESGHIETLA
jgi:hypothetical protein